VQDVWVSRFSPVRSSMQSAVLASRQRLRHEILRPIRSKVIDISKQVSIKEGLRLSKVE
jgi:hypothetical protein